MRPLTFDEMDYVSGGGHGPLDDMIIVSAMQFAPLTPGGASLTSGTSGGVSGFSPYGGIDFASLSAAGAEIMRWLAENGFDADPEIVVTATRPSSDNNDPNYAREAFQALGALLGGYVGGGPGGAAGGFVGGVVYDNVKDYPDSVGRPYAESHGGVGYVTGVRIGLP